MKFDTTTYLYTLYGDHEPYSDCQNILIPIGGQLHFQDNSYEVISYDFCLNPYDFEGDEDDERIIEVICEQVSKSNLVATIIRDVKLSKVLDDESK
jgi:nitrogen regulatory protein PII-like uncharacterized protein